MTSFSIHSFDRHFADEPYKQPVQYYPAVQPHGVAIVFAPDRTIAQVSDNTAQVLGIDPDRLLGQPLSSLLTASQLRRLERDPLAIDPRDPQRLTFQLHPGKDSAEAASQSARPFRAQLHATPDRWWILELEPQDVFSDAPPDLYRTVRSQLARLQQTADLAELCQIATEEIRKLSGFDRVMTYRFDPDGHGQVIAESKREDLPPLLGLHYPDGDTRPCRHLFSKYYIRAVPDARAVSVPLVPATPPGTDRPLDLGNLRLRGVVPCHQTYLANMGVRSTLVMSLCLGDSLWGLISCHHETPKYLDERVEDACAFLAQGISLELSVKMKTSEYGDRVAAQQYQAQLLEAMSATQDWIEGALARSEALLAMVDATGAAICHDERCETVGKTPSNDRIRAIIAAIAPRIQNNVFYCDRLTAVMDDARSLGDTASGVLAISISASLQQYLLWFRPEYLQTVRWAGDPRQTVTRDPETSEAERLSPRGSFEEWREQVRGQSQPWHSWEIEGALALRDAVLRDAVRQAEELAKLTRELARSNAELEKFAYVASHDLQEPLNLVSSYVQLLEMRYGDRLDEDAHDFIQFAVEGVTHMQRLIDDLLAYSRVGSRGQPFAPTSVAAAIERVQRNLGGRIEESQATLEYEDLPEVMADEIQLVQLFQNLIGNAIKFRGDRPLKVCVGAERLTTEWKFWIRDNGIGLESQFADRIFSIFQRLHTRDEYPGTGIGLAICKRIVERHGGRIWVESQLGEGATFYFTIPFVSSASLSPAMAPAPEDMN